MSYGNGRISSSPGPRSSYHAIMPQTKNKKRFPLPPPRFTTKEFDLLTFLAENPNRVFTKEELFREIWDMESIGDIATVTVHIKKIREKIEFNTAKPQYIETIWGVGYRFKA